MVLKATRRFPRIRRPTLHGRKSTAALLGGDFGYESKPFYEDPKRQLRLADDWSWLAVDSLDGFVEEALAVLEADPALADRLPALAEGLERQEHLVRLLA